MNTDMAPCQTQPPALNQIDLIVDDMDASIGFYRLIGLDMPDAPTWPPASGARHTGTMTAGGASLELDNPAMARIWDAGFRNDTPTRVVISLALSTAEAVDQTYARATEAGHRGVQVPSDAFWGARYAIVADPDGNHVGLMGPVDQARRYVPSAAS
jgi:uncharacterized glyoxalase superfamily protein PhnB